jgi:hypothetical protein
MKLRTGLICFAIVICMLMNSVIAAAVGTSILTDNNSSSQSGSVYSQTFPDIEGHWCREYIEKFLK